jgi:DNA recombination protein Rad52
MTFTPTQRQELSAKLKHKHVKTRRTSDGELAYVEGWHAIAEANRIFGFDAWDRKTLSAKCVWSEKRPGRSACFYTAKVRITVRAGSTIVVREGTGTGHSEAASPGIAHDMAIKSAETDGTKRALATFGNPFGLALYDRNRSGVTRPHTRRPKSLPNSADERAVLTAKAASAGDRKSGLALEARPASIRKEADVDKSKLAIREPKRIRCKAHLKFVARQPCVVCGRQPSQPHHVQFAQPRALGRKVGDEFTVPLCVTHHRQLHDAGNEREWWKGQSIDPLKVADGLWREQLNGRHTAGSATSAQSES